MGEILFIGIDQTGALDRNGKPRPLPTCLIRKNQVQFFYLSQFNKKCLSAELQIDLRDDVFICVDCVLGLPVELNLSLRQALKLIPGDLVFGRGAAQRYFHQIGQGEIVRRKVEITCGANSVFKEKPFQRNIQTGTFRIWKDLSGCEDDFHVPFLNESSRNGSIPIFEGYPSLSWKLLFGVKQRTPKELLTLVGRHSPKLKISPTDQIALERDPNLADACVLAIMMQQNHEFKSTDRIYDQEGWILGAPFDLMK